MRQRILIDPAWWWRDEHPPPFWEDMQRAVYEDRCIQVRYQRHTGDVIERQLEPYSLVAKSSVWYLLAGYAGVLHAYRVARFHDLTLLDVPFQRRADFDLPTYWRAHMQQFRELPPAYQCTLHLHPDQMHVLRNTIPGRYKQIPPVLPDGWVTVQVHLDSMALAAMLVFSLGDRAIVVAPQELHNTVVTTARAILTAATSRERILRNDDRA